MWLSVLVSSRSGIGPLDGAYTVPPCFLGQVYALVRHLDEFIERAHRRRAGCDADADAVFPEPRPGGDPHLCHALQKGRRDRHRAFKARCRAQHHEFVATESEDQVVGAEAVPEFSCEFHQ